MRIRNNIPGINTSRNQGIVKGQLGKSLEKLSSGYRINRAGDDAAGLALSEGMRAQIRGINQAMSNVNDGISMVNTGEGTLTEVHSMLHRLETLAIESANGTYNSIARENVNKEKEQLLSEIDRICENANFNQIPLFDADANPIVPAPQKSQQGDIGLQIGAYSRETMDVGFYYLGSKALEIDNMDFGTIEGANKAIDTLENAIQAVTVIRSDFGASQNHLEHTHNNLSVTSENMTAAESAIRDTNMAEEITRYTSRNVVLQSAVSMQTQANTMAQTVLSLIGNAG